MRSHSIFLLILFALQQGLVAEVKVTTRFVPPRIAMGDQSQYIVEVEESSSKGKLEIEPITELPITEPDGLTLSNGRISNSQQANIANGSVEYSVTQKLTIDASPSKLGRFTIPAYILDYKGQRLEVPAATLQVVERSADAGPARDEMVFLKADLPDSLYIGQTIAFDLKLYVAEDVRLNGLNAFDRNADGFTVSELPEKPSEGVEMFKGRRYRTITWPLTLTAIQTGEHPLSFQFALTARLPGQDNRRNSIGRSPFGGSLLDDFFGRSERLNIYTDPISIDVRPLPEAGRPASFSGAIGDLAMEVGTDADQTVQGEPIMLSVVLKGRGNFERINGPGFPESADWRHYDPESKFEANDPLGLSGSLRFDYVFIPQRAGDLTLPEVRFSYFDPEQKEYVELTAPPIPLKVLPAKNNPAPPPSKPAPELPENNLKLSKTLTSAEALLTLDYRPVPPRPVGYTILRSPLFIAFNTMAGLLFAASAVALNRRKRNRKDPTYPIRAAADQSLKQAKQAYRQALGQNDTEALYKHGQSAIRHAATIRTGRSMQSADKAQIESLLTGQAAEDCRNFFEAADAHRFGGHSRKDISDAQQQIETILKAL